MVRNIFASDETNQDYYNRAVKFRGKATDLEKFTEQAREFGLDPRFAPNITKDQADHSRHRGSHQDHQMGLYL